MSALDWLGVIVAVGYLCARRIFGIRSWWFEFDDDNEGPAAPTAGAYRTVPPDTETRRACGALEPGDPVVVCECGGVRLRTGTCSQGKGARDLAFEASIRAHRIALKRTRSRGPG